MAGGEPHRLGIRGDIVQADRRRRPEQPSEDSLHGRRITDRAVDLLVHAPREEALQDAPRGVEHPDRGIARSRQLAG